MKLNLSENFATYVAMMLGDWLLTVSPPQGCTNGVTWFRRVNTQAMGAGNADQPTKI